MSVRDFTAYTVACDWPGCRRTSGDLNLDNSAWPTREEALADWANCEGVNASNGKQYCDEHATDVCVECGSTTDLVISKDYWSRCPEHFAKDAS